MSRPVLPMVLGFSLHSYLPIFLTLLLGLNALPGSWRGFPSSAPLSANLFSSFSEWLPRCSGPRNGAHGPHQPSMLRNSVLTAGSGWVSSCHPLALLDCPSPLRCGPGHLGTLSQPLPGCPAATTAAAIRVVQELGHCFWSAGDSAARAVTRSQHLSGSGPMTLRLGTQGQ